MRRAIAATVIGGLVLGGAVATPSVAATRGADKAPPTKAAPKKPASAEAKTKTKAEDKAKAKAKAEAKAKAKAESAAAMKTVAYAGYEFQVPASWPVYRLDQHPQTCVRYDVHAVYLGTPGPDMRCTAGLVGRTQTISLIPGQGAAGPSALPGHAAQPQAPGGTVLQRLSAVHGTMTQNAVNHELKVTLGSAAPNATVLGTYGKDPAVVEKVINTLRLAPTGTESTVQSASTQPDQTTANSQRARLSARLAPERAPAPPNPGGPVFHVSPAAHAGKAPKPAYGSKWHGVPAHWPVQIVQPPSPPSRPKPSPAPTPMHPVSGFDTCTAPSTSTMHTWRSHYAAVGVYIGGANAACAGGNLTSSWVKTVAGMGWGLLPTYVGPQAPCWGSRGALINPSSAAAQGSAAGSDAVGDARSVGLPAGSPIYYDMEAYNGGSSCTNAVLTFLGAWDRQVQSAGYVTGVYSSQDSGIVDMQAGAVKKTPGFTPPEAIWIALWDNVASLNDGTLTWPMAARSKQYQGNSNTTVGGITLNIDKDFVGGPLARLAARIP
jgi:hypothetical protein